MELQEQFRAFHLTGQGLDEWLPPAGTCAERRQEHELLLDLYVAALQASRGKARAAFLEKAKLNAARLQGLLAVDDAHRAGTASSADIAAGLGPAGAFFRTGALEQAFGRQAQASQPMEQERRARCATTLDSLDQALRDEAKQPPFVMFHSGAAPSGLAAAGGESRSSDDPCTAALEFSRQQLQRWARLSMALRMARLDISGAFDTVHHTAAFARFDWQTAEADELAACTPVVVWEPAEKLAASSLTSYVRLLRSGYPVQILAPWGGLRCDPAAFAAELGLFSMVHGEAVVVQSSFAKLDHVQAGLARMAASLRPSVAMAAEPTALAMPLFSFDPDRGTTLREHLDLAPEAAAELNPAALVLEMRDEIRVIPESAWNGDQIEWTEYLDRYTHVPPLSIPFLRVPCADGGEQRAVMTRQLVQLIRDRRRSAEMLSELAGGPPRPDSTGVAQARRDGAVEAIQQVLVLIGGASART